jgi:lambda repressor-like predicted transcriptional regulator
MKDLQVTLRVRNNRILSAIKRAGYATLVSFAEANHLKPSTVSAFITMKKSPVSMRSNPPMWNRLAWDLATALKCEPEVLWPAHMVRLRNKGKLEYLVDVNELELIGTSRSMDLADFEKLLSILTPLEREKIEARVSGDTYTAIKNDLNLDVKSNQAVALQTEKIFEKLRKRAKRLGLSPNFEK